MYRYVTLSMICSSTLQLDANMDNLNIFKHMCEKVNPLRLNSEPTNWEQLHAKHVINMIFSKPYIRERPLSYFHMNAFVEWILTAL